MPLTLTEHDLQVHIFDVLRLNEALDPRLRWIYAVPNGNFRSWSIGKRLKAEGVKSGISDICLPFDGVTTKAQGFLITHHPGAYIEMKSETGEVSPEQKAFLEFAASQHYATLVAFHFDPALDFIEEYCNIKLRGRENKPRKI